MQQFNHLFFEGRFVDTCDNDVYGDALDPSLSVLLENERRLVVVLLPPPTLQHYKSSSHSFFPSKNATQKMRLVLILMFGEWVFEDPQTSMLVRIPANIIWPHSSTLLLLSRVSQG